ncbi:putative Fe-containing alcohol dehydrogenase [Xylariales sp. PMI_506]|nr:putative Fe-containing alcohol dehydrogenase [Xylariales sp. PMI_506]
MVQFGVDSSRVETLQPAFPGRERPLVSYGLPFTSALIQHIDDMFGASKVYLICSASLSRKTSHVSSLKSQLGSKIAGVRVGMKPHTLWGEVLEVVMDAKSCRADLLVTLGAGSLTDAAKLISFALANGVSTFQELDSICPTSLQKREVIQPSQIPVVCIPTSLSGGEYGSTAGATNERDGRKYSFWSNGMPRPALVILDPELCVDTPEHIWLSTGVRALDHCVETLCSLHSNEASDHEAQQGLRMLIPGLLKCKQDGKDFGARLECQLGVIDAMRATQRGVPLGASHGIGHQLGPAGVGHGETSCILLPAVCKYNYEKGANRERQDDIVKLLWTEPSAVKVFEANKLEKQQADLGDLLDAIIRALNMPRSLRDFGVGEDKLDGIVEHSLQDRWVQTNPARLDEMGVLQILRMVMEPRPRDGHSL